MESTSYPMSAPIYMKKDCAASTEIRQKGNKMYSGKDHSGLAHKAILSHYTQSIAFAPNNSVELAMAYGNRSALLMHLRKYEECLIDVKRALKIPQSVQLTEKLQSRRKECLKLIVINRSREFVEERDEIAIPESMQSKEIPCAADCVSLAYNEKFGRHMIATRDIKPGEIIIVERGYVVFPEKEQMYLACSHCLSFCWNGIPCDGCVFAIYCNTGCKLQAWQEYHNVECHVIKNILCQQNMHKNLTEILTSIRFFIIAVKKEGIKRVIREAKFMDNEKGIYFAYYIIYHIMSEVTQWVSTRTSVLRARCPDRIAVSIAGIFVRREKRIYIP